MDEKDPLAELEELLAAFAKQIQETLSTGTRVVEAAKAAVKRAKESKTRVVPARSKVKAAGFYGKPEERTKAFVETLREKIDGAFTIEDAGRAASLPRRTTQRRLDEAIEMGLVIREDFGWYRVK